MQLLELICDLFDVWTAVWCSWRFYVCAVASVLCAIAIHRSFDGGSLVWGFSILLICIGFAGGVFWQIRVDRTEKGK